MAVHCSESPTAVHSYMGASSRLYWALITVKWHCVKNAAAAAAGA
jgi:hypothetical protein